MADQIKINDSKVFMDIAKKLYKEKAETWQNGSENYVITIIDKPTNFAWHQRIFPVGMILHLTGSNVRIFIEKEKLI
jgi:hypothetical protein